MTVDQAIDRLRQLAHDNGGRLTAEIVRADPLLAADHETAAAAAHRLASEPNVSCTEGDPQSWFPYTVMTFST